jgi:hypothetical protein
VTCGWDAEGAPRRVVRQVLVAGGHRPLLAWRRVNPRAERLYAGRGHFLYNCRQK